MNKRVIEISENYLEALSMSGVDKDYAAEYKEELLDVLFAD